MPSAIKRSISLPSCNAIGIQHQRLRADAGNPSIGTVLCDLKRPLMTKNPPIVEFKRVANLESSCSCHR